MISNFIKQMIAMRGELGKITLTISEKNLGQVRTISKDSNLSVSQIVDLLLSNAIEEWNLMLKAEAKNYNQGRQGSSKRIPIKKT